MKFPLNPSPFPTLLLSREGEHTLKDVAETVVQSTVQQYHELLAEHNSVVNECRWKKVKLRDDICVYRERRSFANNASGRSFSVSSSSSSSQSSFDSEKRAKDPKDPPRILLFGSITGNLDDVMYGMLSPSSESMQLKTAYVSDGFVDWAVLATIIKPSAQDPFRNLNIKWMVKGHPLLIGAVMRTRDVVLIESVGIAVTPDGERIGYHLHHSVDIPEIRELSELQIVRAKMSFCQFFRQRKENCVEVYGQGVFNPMGDALAGITAATVAEVAVSLRKHAHYAEMKKLTRILCATPRPSLAAAASFSSGKCTVCSQSARGSGISFSSSSSSKEKRCCRICSALVCSRCRVSKTAYLSTRIEKELSEIAVSVCTRCVLRVSCASSTTFAMLDALEAEGKRVDFAVALE